MTNKIPVVGKRYKIRNQLGSGNGEIVMVVSVDKDFFCKLYFEKSDSVCSELLPLASFCNICEELPQDNSQETDKIPSYLCKECADKFEKKFQTLGYGYALHTDICPVCNEEKALASATDYGLKYEFELLKKHYDK